MKKYLLDTNIIIKLWNEDENVIDSIVQDKTIRVLREVLNELAVKETRVYRGKEVLSERFCKLLSYSISIDRDNISGFYMIFDYETEKEYKNNNLSDNDLMQLYACYINDEYIMVTEDKTLAEIGKRILEDIRVISLDEFKSMIK